MNPYATHMPTLTQLISQYNIQKVFEFGCGEYSTKLFLDQCDIVYSCEMQNYEWYIKIQQKYQLQYEDKLTITYFEENVDNANIRFNSIDYFKSLGQNFDMVFVDGHSQSRWLCINEAQFFTNIIVTHDTEDRGYLWDRVNLPECWKKTDVKNHRPWTTYWIKSEQL